MTPLLTEILSHAAKQHKFSPSKSLSNIPVNLPKDAEVLMFLGSNVEKKPTVVEQDRQDRKFLTQSAVIRDNVQAKVLYIVIRDDGFVTQVAATPWHTTQSRLSAETRELVNALIG